MKFLIAEDDSTSALVLRRSLERLGHEVVVAADGEEAWKELADRQGEIALGRFDVLITD